MQEPTYRIDKEASRAPRRSSRPKRKKDISYATSVVSKDMNKVDREIFTRTNDSLYAASGLAESGNYFAAEQMYHRLFVPEKQAFAKIAEVCLEKQRYETAAIYFRKSEQPERTGDAFLAAGKFFAAGKCFEEARNEQKADDAFNKGGIMALKAGNYGIALECFKRIDNQELVEKTVETIKRLEAQSRAKIEAIRENQPSTERSNILAFRKA